ncbi:MAG: tetratricopeptide repeat protein [Nonlabens sp.]|uniref:tetratricopeptide repeat protein n=1 Tax=Nonlabens sp. TaxID=1888209 RepID=UPI0032193104
MKLKLTILFLALASIAMAQKKEIRKIEKAIEKGDFSKAQEIFQSIDESAVEEKYAGSYYFYKAASLMDLTGATKVTNDQVHEAEASLLKAKEFNFENPKLEPMLKNIIDSRKLEIANEMVAAGNSKDALILVEELYKSNPSNLSMLYNAGNLAYSSEMFDKAIEHYNVLLEKKFTGEKVSYLATNKAGVVEAFSNQKVRDYAIKARSHTDPSSEKSPSMLGDIVLKTVWLYTNKGDKSKANQVYEKALKDFPQDNSLKLVKSDIYLTLGMMDKYKEAIDNMDSDITDPRVFDNLGAAAMKSKNYDSAMRYFQSSIKLDPSNYYALVNLSNANLEKGNLAETSAEDQELLYKEAITNLEKAHQVKPEEKGVVATLVSLYDFLGMKEKSAAMKAKM